MGTVFTEFVRQMDGEGGGPDPELSEHLWQALRGILAVEMKRRSAWQTRPSFLGIVGHRNWTEPGQSSDGLDELVSECFEHIFVVRLGSLRRQARKKPSIDGLVLLGVRQFLLAAQSRNDPLGFRVFEILQRALQDAVSRGQLVVIQGGTKIRNGTYLALEATTSPEAARGVDISPLAQQWADRRLDALVNASHQRLVKLKEGLVHDLLAFLGPERPGFRFGDLAAPLKEQVRRAWAARFLNMPGFMAWRDEDTPVESAAEALLLRQYVAAVVRCLDRSEERDLDAKTRQYLSWLWGYLKGFAFEDLKRFVAGLVRRAEAEVESDPDIFPTARQLEALLGIPRARLPKLFERLRQQWQRCSDRVGYPRQQLAMSNSEMEDGAMATSRRAGKTLPDPKGRAMEALRKALEADSGGRVGHGGPGSSTVEASTLRPGYLFIVPWAEVDGVEWLLVEVDADGSTLRCCPTDQFPLAAASDLDLRWEDTDEEPRVVRLGLETALTEMDLGIVEVCGQLSPPALAAVLERRAQAASTEAVSTEDLTSELPAYREWLADGPRRAHDLVLSGHRRPSSTSSPSSPGPPAAAPESPAAVLRWPSWANAALLLISVGLAAGLGWTGIESGRRIADLGENVHALERQVAILETPIVDMPFDEIRLGSGDPRGTNQVEIPPGATWFRLVFQLQEGLPEFPEYRLDFLSETGELLFQTPPFGFAFEKTVTLPVRMIDAGSVEVHLIGLRAGREETLDEQIFVKVLPGGGF